MTQTQIHPLKQWRLNARPSKPKGLTLEEAGIEVGVGAASFHRYENGERIPDRETMDVIREKTGLEPNAFYEFKPKSLDAGEGGQHAPTV